MNERIAELEARVRYLEAERAKLAAEVAALGRRPPGADYLAYLHGILSEMWLDVLEKAPELAPRLEEALASLEERLGE